MFIVIECVHQLIVDCTFLVYRSIIFDPYIKVTECLSLCLCVRRISLTASKSKWEVLLLNLKILFSYSYTLLQWRIFWLTLSTICRSNLNYYQKIAQVCKHKFTIFVQEICIVLIIKLSRRLIFPPLVTYIYVMHWHNNIFL